MKTNSIKTGIVGMLLVGLTSCEKPALKKSTYPLLTKSTMEVVDSFAKEGKKILNNPEYKCYAVDTVPIEFFMTSSMLEKRLNKRADLAMPKTKIGEKLEEKRKFIGRVLHYEKQTVDINAPNYIKPKAVIDNSHYYSYSWHEIEHVPVKYYGIPNPKLK